MMSNEQSHVATSAGSERPKRGGVRFLTCACGAHYRHGGHSWEEIFDVHLKTCATFRSIMCHLAVNKFEEAGMALIPASDSAIKFYAKHYRAEMCHLQSGLVSTSGGTDTPTDVAGSLRDELKQIVRRQKKLKLQHGLSELLALSRDTSPSPKRQRCMKKSVPEVAGKQRANLDLLIEPGDTFGTLGGWGAVGQAGGLMGHMYVAISTPFREESFDDSEGEVWGVRGVESTGQEKNGVFQAIYYFKINDNRLVLFAERAKGKRTAVHYEKEMPVLLFQSPFGYTTRRHGQVLERAIDRLMRAGNWSLMTGFLAVRDRVLLRSKMWEPSTSMHEIEDDWVNPICSSMVVIFHQIFLKELAVSALSGGKQDPTVYGLLPVHPFMSSDPDAVASALILKYMPLKACVTPGELADYLEKLLGWIKVETIPRLSR